MVTEAVILKILDGILFLGQAGLNHQVIVGKIRDKIADGVPPEEVAVMIRDGRIKSEIEAQEAINRS